MAVTPTSTATRSIRWHAIPLISAFVLTFGAYVQAEPGVGDLPPRRSGTSRQTTPTTALPNPGILKLTIEVLPLTVENIRLEQATPMETVPSATLKFDMFNAGPNSFRDIVVEISIRETSIPEEPDAPRRVLAGPYTIVGKVPLQPGYSAAYEIRLRNIAPDCGCAASVNVLSAR